MSEQPERASQPPVEPPPTTAEGTDEGAALGERTAATTEQPRSQPPRPNPRPSQGPKIEPIRAMRVIAIGGDSASPAAESPPDSHDEAAGPPVDLRAPAVPQFAPESAAPVTAPSGTNESSIEPVAKPPGPSSIPAIEMEEASLEDLGEDFDERELEAHALSDEDLLESHSEEPPAVVPRSAPSPPVRSDRGHSGRVGLNEGTQADLDELEAVPEDSGRKAPPPVPARSTKPALPSAKPRKKPWWEEIFGDDFSRAHKPLTEAQAGREALFISQTLELQKGSVVLDLCCGQGQHAVELSRLGFPVVGYDLSVFQLAVAADSAQAARQKINFLQGDMREMAFDSMFDAIVSWDTSFGYFEEEKNFDVAKRMFAALKPGGSLLLDVMNRDYAAREAPNNHWFEGDGCICMDDMSLDWITSRLKVKRSVILDDGRSKELTYSIRLYNLSEIGKLLHDVGFRVLSVSGALSTPGAFLGSRSPRIIIRAQKPGS